MKAVHKPCKVLKVTANLLYGHRHGAGHAFSREGKSLKRRTPECAKVVNEPLVLTTFFFCVGQVMLTSACVWLACGAC